MATFCVEPSVLASDMCGSCWLSVAAYSVEARNAEAAYSYGLTRARAEGVDFDDVVVWLVVNGERFETGVGA